VCLTKKPVRPSSYTKLAISAPVPSEFWRTLMRTLSHASPWFNKLSKMGVQLGKGPLIIDAYQAAVTGYIRDKNCHKSAFNFLTGHSY